MSNYIVSEVFKNDKTSIKQVNELLEKQAISLDKNAEYTAAIYDRGEVIATGSIYKNTLRSLAVSDDRKGEALMNLIVGHLIDYANQNGYYHLFLYAKIESAPIFKNLGFYEITRVENVMAFMENERSGFKDYLKSLNKPEGEYKNISSIVMNANPLTKGHLYLIEKALKDSDLLHLFIVSEDESAFDFKSRMAIVKKAIKDIDNIVLQETGAYLISSASFPSYFIKSDEKLIKVQAKLDAKIFTEIGKELGIKKRYVGSEKKGSTTYHYNQSLKKILPKSGIDLVEIDRVEDLDGAISASKVRKLIKEGKIDQIKEKVPKATYDFLKSSQAKEIIEKIKNTSN